MKKNLSRRTFLKGGATAVGAIAAVGVLRKTDPVFAVVQGNNNEAPASGKAKVFFTKDLSAESLQKMYRQVSGSLTGKVAVKLHTGEPEGPNLIPRDWVKALIPQVPNPTIVETNVLYESPRLTTEGHRHTLKVNGWDFCPVDILDEHGDADLPISGGKHMQHLEIGKNLLNYDSMLVLTHFKGHPMGGFGGSLKNVAVGCASGRGGKQQIHLRFQDGVDWPGGQDFMERMVEAGKAVTDHFGQKIVYINVMRNMSVDCDCMGLKAAPVVTPDLGIMASTDILAIDQACVDMVYALPEAQKKDLVERIESRGGLRQLTYMRELGMGRAEYDLVTI